MKGKYEQLKEVLGEMGTALIAFSGGVDSTFLLQVAKEVLGEKILAVNIVSEINPQEEREEAKLLAKELGVKLNIMEAAPLEMEAFITNPPDRCYHCKTALFTQLKEIAAQQGLKWVLDGSNASDLGDYRPGKKALQELEIRSPLLEVGLTKEEIRVLSKEVGLPTWNKPGLACLASRFPYGTRITKEKLGQVEKGERYLRSLGLQQLRVRHHGEIVRLEVLPEDILLLAEKRTEVVGFFKELGFVYIALDLEGYRTGSLNQGVGEQDAV